MRFHRRVGGLHDGGRDTGERQIRRSPFALAPGFAQNADGGHP
jgi:hypothetical protein